MSFRAFFLKGDNQYFKSNEFVSDNVFTAFYGFSILGWDCQFFTKDELPYDLTRNDVVVAGIGSVKKAVIHLGFPELEEIDYPEDLEGYYGRKIWTDNLKSVYMGQDKWPIFVKPKRQKLFTGKFIQSTRDVIGLGADESIECWCSEPVDFVSEWRCFVRYGEILDVRLYKGTWEILPNPGVIRSAIKAYESAPNAYGIDFGVTSDGRTLVVEVNDAFSLGSYGLAPIKYAQLLATRWYQIMDMPDPIAYMGNSMM